MKWVLFQGSGNGVDHEVKKVVALSAGMVEALAGRQGFTHWNGPFTRI